MVDDLFRGEYLVGLLRRDVAKDIFLLVGVKISAELFFATQEFFYSSVELRLIEEVTVVA